MSTIEIPSPVLSINPTVLFGLILRSCGQEVVDVVKVQGITNIESFLWTPDILAFVHLPAAGLKDLKRKVAFELDDGSWSIMSGFRTRVDLFTDALRSQALLEENARSSNLPTSDDLTLTADLLIKFPVLLCLVRFYSNIQQISDSSDHSFLISMINNITDNLSRSTNNYRYSDHVRHFAYSLFILGGQNTYEFVRINIPGLLPSKTTVKNILRKSSNRMYEGQFYFDSMANHFSSTGSILAFAAEDCTGVVSKVTYDSSSNSFVGFATPMDNGYPQFSYYKTDSYQELETWFIENKKSSFINAHIVQPISSSSSAVKTPSSFILSAYGVDNTFTSDDILARWLWIYDQSLLKGIRIIGYSTDCDNRYLSSMRIASTFFASNIVCSIREHPGAYKVNLPTHWAWYYLDARQLFVFMQVRAFNTFCV